MSTRFNGSFYIDSQGYDAVDKSASDKLDYLVNFNNSADPWLPEGDEILSATFSVPSGLTKESESYTTSTATVWLSGGTAGKSYLVSCTATTTNTDPEERIVKRSFKVHVK